MLYEQTITFILEANIDLILARAVVRFIVNKCEQIWIGTSFVPPHGFISTDEDHDIPALPKIS
jgi:hypothetical protein